MDPTQAQQDVLPPSPEELAQVADMMASGQWGAQPDPSVEKAKEALRQMQLQMFGLTMSKLRDDWVSARAASGVDRRWAEDEDQYNGEDEATRSAVTMMEVVEAGGPPARQNGNKLQTRSTIFVNMTRSKTNAGEAHLSDIVLPVDERNWGVSATPNAEIAKELNDHDPATINDQQGQPQPVMGPKLDPNGRPQLDENGAPIKIPQTKRDVALAIQKMADESAEAMQREIEDQLTECDYIGELRKMLHDAARLGTGVMCGPIVTRRTRKAWVPMGQDASGKTVYALKVVSSSTPASYRKDPRFIWPDPACGDNVQNGRGVIEMEEMTAKRVRDLIDQPGYIREQVANVLLQGPVQSQAYVDMRRQLRLAQEASKEPLYQVWTYTGQIDVEDLMAVGVPGLQIPEDPIERILMKVSGVVVVINNTVVHVSLNPLESGDLPYDFFQWEKVADSVFGFGVPYLMRAQQRVINSAWRQMMDNSAATVLPQIVLRRNAITPATANDYSIFSGKVWYAKDDVTEVEKAFMMFDIPNHQERLQQIIQMAEDLSDKETGQPQLAQGEQGSAPETVGGMQMLMNATNVVRRRQVKSFDDDITKPHIRRYYDYNMAYSEKDEIKGDFMVDARGTSALLVRDIQNQAFLSLLQTAANPLFGKYTDMRKLYAKALQAQHIKPDDVLKSEDQVEREEKAAQENPPPPSDRVQVAQIMAEAQQAIAKIREETALQVANLAAQNRESVANLVNQMKLMELAHEKGMTLDEAKVEMSKIAIQQRAQDRRQEAAAAFHQQTGEAIQ